VAVAFVSSTVDNSGSSFVSSGTISAPTSISAGNCLILAITISGDSTVTFTPPTGFITPFGSLQNGTSNFTTRIFYKIATGSEPSTYSYSFGTSSLYAATLTNYSGTSNSLPISTGLLSAKTTSGTTTNSFSTRSIYDPGYNLKIVSSLRSAGSNSVASSGSGWTTRADTTSTASVSVQTAVIDGVTSTTLQPFTVNAVTFTSSADANTLLTVALRADQTVYTTPHIDYAERTLLASGTSVSISPRIADNPEIMYAAITIANATTTVSSITSAFTTWTKVTDKQDSSNITRVELWSAPASIGNGTYTSTVNFVSSADAIITVFTFSGSSLNLGAVATNAGTSGAPTVNVTTTADNSLVLSISALNAVTAATAVSGTTLEASFIHTDTTKAHILTTQNTLPPSGTTTSNGITAPTASNWSIIGFEVISDVSSRLQIGIARITAKSAKTQTGVARISIIVPRVQLGKAFIIIPTTKTQLGKARITAVASRVQLGKAFIVRKDTYTKPYMAGINKDVVTTGVEATAKGMRGIISNL
jgi:hypothetical protein